jgi:predicted amidohydrolase
MVLAYANYCGPEGSLRYGGLSSVVDALGRPLAVAGRDESLLIARLTPEALDHARAEQTHLQECAQRLRGALPGAPSGALPMVDSKAGPGA